MVTRSSSNTEALCGAAPRRALRAFLALAGLALAIACGEAALYAANVMNGLHAAARTSGTLALEGLHAPVTVIRDDRGIPHIEARDLHDLFFAQGFVEGEDRLFQMDLVRRFVEGRLAELFGAAALPSDERMRAWDVREIAQRQWEAMPADDRTLVDAFTAGIDAAIRTQPLPVEYRILLVRPEPWTPQDVLAAGMATVIDLTEDWNDVAARDAIVRKGGIAALRAARPLSDSCYDVPVLVGLRAVRPAASCAASDRALSAELRDERARLASNAWAASAGRTRSGRALLANDPHLRLQIPGVWYLVDLRAPGFHAAGATLAGTPGVILGHDDRLAWGVTAGTTADLSLFEFPAHPDPRFFRTERFRVRFGGTVVRRYYRTADAFDVRLRDGKRVLVRWIPYERPRSAFPVFFALDRARSMQEAIAALRQLQAPSLNVVLAAADGTAAYLLAGSIPDDPAWGRWIHPASDLVHHYPDVPHAALPYVPPSRDAVVWTANNLMYGPGYPYRLSAQFAPPYRAYRIARLLQARTQYDLPYFTRMQLDVRSPAECELARRTLAALRGLRLTATEAVFARVLDGWDCEVTPQSRGATLAVALRGGPPATDEDAFLDLLTAARRATTAERKALAASFFATVLAFHGNAAAVPAWRRAGAVSVLHPLARLGVRFLDGTPFPGNGDAFTLRTQKPGFSQSFRAVWEIGAWDRGGITIPEGESGEPGSGHYTDQARAWIAGRLIPLPYSRAAVARAAAERLVLLPAAPRR